MSGPRALMPPGLRRAALAVHVVTSVGWIGACAAYLSLGVTAATSEHLATVQAAWTGMAIIGWSIIVPLGCLAFLTGVVMALATPWGLIQHYWVLIALVLTGLSLTVLLLHMPTVSAAAAAARAAADVTAARQGGDVVHPALGLVVLVIVAVLNLFKPRGLTPYGRQAAAGRRRERRRSVPLA